MMNTEKEKSTKTALVALEQKTRRDSIGTNECHVHRKKYIGNKCLN